MMVTKKNSVDTCQRLPSAESFLPLDARVVEWQTRTFEGRMPKGMRVQVPPRARFLSSPKSYGVLWLLSAALVAIANAERFWLLNPDRRLQPRQRPWCCLHLEQ